MDKDETGRASEELRSSLLLEATTPDAATSAALPPGCYEWCWTTLGRPRGPDAAPAAGSGGSRWLRELLGHMLAAGFVVAPLVVGEPDEGTRAARAVVCAASFVREVLRRPAQHSAACVRCAQGVSDRFGGDPARAHTLMASWYVRFGSPQDADPRAAWLERD